MPKIKASELFDSKNYKAPAMSESLIQKILARTIGKKTSGFLPAMIRYMVPVGVILLLFVFGIHFITSKQNASKDNTSHTSQESYYQSKVSGPEKRQAFGNTADNEVSTPEFADLNKEKEKVYDEGSSSSGGFGGFAGQKTTVNPDVTGKSSMQNEGENYIWYVGMGIFGVLVLIVFLVIYIKKKK